MNVPPLLPGVSTAGRMRPPLPPTQPGLGTSAPAIWPRVAPADCPLPKGVMLFSTFLSTYKKWSMLCSLFAQGKSVFVPRVEGPERDDMRMVRVQSTDQLDAFPRSKWGIPEPTAAEAATLDDGLVNGAIDTVIVPAVAFDPTCHRLGHGKGYYGTLVPCGGAGGRAGRARPIYARDLNPNQPLIVWRPLPPHPRPQTRSSRSSRAPAPSVASRPPQ
jgi:hypothetical protein